MAAAPRAWIAMPLGVGAPGTPVLSHLRASLDSIARQTCDDYHLTACCDENVPAEAIAMLQAYGADIAWYPVDTYFRPGGIWKKVTDVWSAVSSEHVAYLHYDDVWAPDKLERQLELIDHRGLNGCYTAAFRIDNDGRVLSGDLARPVLTPDLAREQPGPWVVHSALVNRRGMLESGLMEHESRWAAVFEWLFFVYLLKLGRIEKCATTAFLWRDHPSNITNTAREDAEFVVQQRARTSYSLAETMADADAIDVAALAERLHAGTL